MNGPSDPGPALSLVHEGWAHLKQERPLAAWASWRRALRLDPGQPAASRALELLAASPELSISCRKEYQFRTTRDPARRARWDVAFRGRDLSDLAVAASAFAGLADDDPADADAMFNQGLCLAWLGENVEAIEALDRSINAGAAVDFVAAVAAGLLIEVLRRGDGAGEYVSLDETCGTVDLAPPVDPLAFGEALGARVNLRRIPSPIDPARSPDRADLIVNEWLDRPFPDDDGEPPRLDAMPRLVAVLLTGPTTCRLSFPHLADAGRAWETLHAIGVDAASKLARRAIPLARVDAEVWSVRLPAWVEESDRDRLLRERVETYFEDVWVQAYWNIAEESRRGDLAWRARLAASVAFREEQADRPAALGLYRGYPFDRLRHRLGLEPVDPSTVDPVEIRFMTPEEIGRLDLDALDPDSLAEAVLSAEGLDDFEGMNRLAAHLVATRSPALARLDLPKALAEWIEEPAWSDDEGGRLRRIDEAIALDEEFRSGRGRLRLLEDRARSLIKLGEVDAAVAVYRSLFDGDDENAPVYCGSRLPIRVWAGLLRSAGHGEAAREVAALALDAAHARGEAVAAREAEEFLRKPDPEVDR